MRHCVNFKLREAGFSFLQSRRRSGVFRAVPMSDGENSIGVDFFEVVNENEKKSGRELFY